ncbi:MAG: hypothetical protein CVT86_08365, partial [Alphaproteobacteria bacterium HGW-Alphaproteobacteria-8]
MSGVECRPKSSRFCCFFYFYQGIAANAPGLHETGNAGHDALRKTTASTRAPAGTAPGQVESTTTRRNC